VGGSGERLARTPYNGTGRARDKKKGSRLQKTVSWSGYMKGGSTTALVAGSQGLSRHGNKKVLRGYKGSEVQSARFCSLPCKKGTRPLARFKKSNWGIKKADRQREKTCPQAESYLRAGEGKGDIGTKMKKSRKRVELD